MMLKRSIPIFILSGFLALSSCSDRPSNVLDEDDMVDLMVDMELAEAYYEQDSRSSSADDRIEFGKRVLQKHGVSAETLDTTLAWYGRNLDEYTELFAKVDKKIEKRKKKLMEVPGQEERPKSETDLWIFSSHIMLSELSGQNLYSFSIPNVDLNKGDKLKFSFYLPNSVGLKTTLGVEYADGFGEAEVNNSTSGKSIEMELQTDTAREVKRVFGWLNLKESTNYPVFIDSLALKTMQMDSATYMSSRRSQKDISPIGKSQK